MDILKELDKTLAGEEPASPEAPVTKRDKMKGYRKRILRYRGLSFMTSESSHAAAGRKGARVKAEKQAVRKRAGRKAARTRAENTAIRKAAGRKAARTKAAKKERYAKAARKAKRTRSKAKSKRR